MGEPSQDLRPYQADYVLVVGQDGPQRLWIETTLLQGGFVVACVDDGGLHKMRAPRVPRLIVLDDATFRLLRSSGNALPRHLSFKDVPWIVLSDDDSVEGFGGAVAKGAAAYLTPPFDVAELLSAARRLSAYESRPEMNDKRRRIRRPLLIDVEAECRQDGRRLNGWMLDVSGIGCRLDLDQAALTGESLRIMLRVGGRSSGITLSADAKWHAALEGGRYIVGLRFTGTSALLAAKILGAAPSGLT